MTKRLDFFRNDKRKKGFDFLKFEDLQLHPSLLEGILKKCQFKESTEIQKAVVPLVLKGKDIAGLSQTGTGKTAAYVIPLMERILRSRDFLSFKSKDWKFTKSPNETLGEKLENLSEDLIEKEVLGGKSIKDIKKEEWDFSSRAFSPWRENSFVLILVPTRELAIQVKNDIEKIGAFSSIQSVLLYGGVSPEEQKKSIKAGLDFVVSTPGRLIDFCKEGFLSLNQVCAVVFDEADRLFDMGFKEDMKYILRRISRRRQFLAFSATLNFDVLNIMYSFNSMPIEINKGGDRITAENVEDKIFHIGNEEKPRYLLSLFRKHFLENSFKQAIVFSNFKHHVERIAHFLVLNQIPSTSISSLIIQKQRNKIVSAFRSNQGANVLVATDLAARGLDIKGVDMVINYDLPDNPENYVHRIGRTGRGGAKGIAFSLVSDFDLEALSRIEEYLSHKIEMGWLEDKDLVDSNEMGRISERGTAFSLKIKNSPKEKKRTRRSLPYGTKKRSSRDFIKTDKKTSKKKMRIDTEKEKSQKNTKSSKPSSKSLHRDRHLGRHKSKDKSSPFFLFKKKDKKKLSIRRLSSLDSKRKRRQSSFLNQKGKKKSSQKNWKSSFSNWVKKIFSFKK